MVGNQQNKYIKCAQCENPTEQCTTLRKTKKRQLIDTDKLCPKSEIKPMSCLVGCIVKRKRKEIMQKVHTDGNRIWNTEKEKLQTRLSKVCFF